MSNNILQDIQSMQFEDRSAAEALLLKFIMDTFELNVTSVELRPLAVSLNSFNGFITLNDGQKLFFKTHTESDNVIGEYYRAGILADADYPVIQPIMSSTEAGKHLLIYEVIEDPSVFDVAWQIENGNDVYFDVLTSAQYHADDQLLDLYLNTLVHQESESADAAPIHQLFFHRIAHGRLERFYGPLPGKQGKDTFVELPLLGTVAMSEVRSKKWIINGQEYADTIDDLISVAMECLLPAQSGPGIIGHGDAHNGNVFLRLSEKEPSLLYFDPAFAGQHHPLLDLTKPLFHNVFAMWMYFPEEKAKQITIELTSPDEKQWSVNYNYVLHPVRKMFLESKVNRVLVPILQHLKQTKQLRPDWRRYLKAALFCCPFLTMNLTDTSKFPPEISLLGLSMSIEMGSESRGRHSVIDQLLDQVEMALKS